MNRLKEKFNTSVKAEMMKKYGYESVMEIPYLEKIVINMGIGDAVQNSKIIDEAIDELRVISGQKPIVTKAKNSIANFKLREDMAIGAKVTLRGERMFEFFDKLVSIALPRVRDFRGVSENSFDGRGNYSLGIKEQIIFPEINFDKIKKIRGMDVVIVTTANTDEEGRDLLQLLGMPFRKRG